jgi:hypothetical protein
MKEEKEKIECLENDGELFLESASIDESKQQAIDSSILKLKQQATDSSASKSLRED